MNEFHGWFGLSDSPYDSDTSRLNPLIDELHTLRAGFKWTNVPARDDIYTRLGA